MIKKFSLLATAVILSGQIQAAVIPGVTINSVSSEYSSGATDQRRATNIVSGAGLFGEYHSADPKGAMWLTQPATIDGLTNAFVTFDLGAVRSISKMKVWNYNESPSGANVLTRRGVQLADILVAGEDMVFTTNIAGQTFTRATGTFSTEHDTIDMGGVSARYVRINVITNYGEGDFRVGLSEVQFIDNISAPSAVSASRNFLGDRVTVRFSEPVLPSSTTNLANYVIQSGGTSATVLSAALNEFGDSVILKTSTLNSNLVYTVSVQNIRDAADTITVPPAQLNIDPELVLWLKADENVIADGSGVVTEWDDVSGLANNAIAGVPPTRVDGALNGKPVIHFDGLTQVMEVAHNPTLAADRDITIYTVLSIDTLAGHKSPISKCNVNIPSSFDLQIPNSTGTSSKPSLVRGNGSGYTARAATGAGLVPNEYYIVSVVMSGTNATHYLNGNFNGGGFVGAPLGDSGTPIRLGLRADSGTKFAGNLAEVLLLNGAVSDADRATIDSYLGDKYGISVIPISITAQPENTTRSVGQKATFVASAVAGSPVVFYQWQKGTANIPGATNAIYTTPPLVQSDDGSTYRVVVSTPLGVSATSDPATLTVVPDTQAPAIYSATKAGNGTDIVINFSEPVQSASALNAGNYSLNHGATVSSAAMGSSSNIVILTTTGLDANTPYALAIQNVQDLSNNGMTLTRASVLPTSAAIWIRADSGVLANASGLVIQCDDQSTNQNNVLQGEIPRRPLLVPNAINNNPTLRFDGVSNYLEAASSPSLEAITGDLTIFAVANFDDFALGREIISKTANNQPASFDYYVQNSPLVTRLYRGNGTVNGVVTGAAPSPGVPHILSVVMQETNVNHFLDGAPNGSGVLSTTLGDTGAPLRIGSRNDLFQFMKGDLAEVLVFNSALSDADRKIVDDYLGLKYFPFSITEQPVGVTKLEGQTATFTVAASAGAASFEYQWQKNLADIPGATNASYTTPVLTQSDDNSSYRAVIFLPDGTTVNSDAATLTVLPDQEAPTVTHSGKQLWNTTQIVVVFSEAVNPASATNTSNYSLDNGATITGAVIGDSPNQVILTTSGLTDGTPYNLTVQNVVDLFNNTMAQALVQVGYYPANLSLWLDADANVTFDGQNLVSTWGDLSGNGNDASAVIAGSSPLFVANAINGHSVLRFDGTNQFLAANPTESLALTGDMTIFVVANFKDFVSTANEIGIIEKTSGNLAAPYDFYLLKDSGLPRFYRGDGVTSASITGDVAPSAGTVHALTVQTSGNNAMMFLDGQPNGSGTINVTPADAGTLMGIGTRDDLRPKMNGDIAEILIFGESLSEADRHEIDNYLAAKYGIVAAPIPLSIENSGGNFVISWPASAASLILQSTPSLSTPNWVSVTNTVEASDGINRVTISPNGNESYFRLRNP